MASKQQTRPTSPPASANVYVCIEENNPECMEGEQKNKQQLSPAEHYDIPIMRGQECEQRHGRAWQMGREE